MAELQRLDELLFGQLVGAAFDHQHVGLGADIDQIERRTVHLLDVRVGDELAVDQADADAPDGAVPRNVGDGESGAGAVDHRNIGFVDLVGRHELADDLDLIEQAFREERTARTVAEAGRQDFLFGRATFALEVAAGETAGRSVLFTVIDREREPILPGLGALGDGRGDEYIGFANADIDGAIGEFGVRAGGERDPEAGNGNGVFLLHDNGRFGRIAWLG